MRSIAYRFTTAIRACRSVAPKCAFEAIGLKSKRSPCSLLLPDWDRAKKIDWNSWNFIEFHWDICEIELFDFESDRV